PDRLADRRLGKTPSDGAGCGAAYEEVPSACLGRTAPPSCRQVSRPEREHPRYAHEAAITLHTPGRSISGRTCNVSRGGLCATLAEPIAIGTDIEVDLQPVFDDGRQSEPMRLPARLVWC